MVPLRRCATESGCRFQSGLHRARSCAERGRCCAAVGRPSAKRTGSRTASSRLCIDAPASVHGHGQCRVTVHAKATATAVDTNFRRIATCRYTATACAQRRWCQSAGERPIALAPAAPLRPLPRSCNHRCY